MKIDVLTMRFQQQLIDLPNLSDVIDRSPLTISPDNYLVDAITLMSQERTIGLGQNDLNLQSNSHIGNQHKSSYTLVTKKTQILGIITEKDIVRIIAANINLSAVKVNEVMTRQVVTLAQSSSENVLTALSLLRQHRIRHLPIVDEQGQLLGMVTESDLLQAFDLVELVNIIGNLQPSTGEVSAGEQLGAIVSSQQLEQCNHPEKTVSPELEITYEELQNALEELQIAEEELRQQNEELAVSREVMELERQRYQDLFEFAPDGYLVTDAVGAIKEANQAAAAMLGVNRQYLVGKPIVVFIAQSNRHSVMTQLYHGQQLQEWEIYIQPRGGEPFPASVRVKALHNSQGQLIDWRWSLRDISDRHAVEAALRRVHDELEIRVAERTAELCCANLRLQAEIAERQRIEAALQQSEKLYRDLVQSQNELVIRFDHQGQANFANLAACRTLGLSIDELHRQTLFEFVHPDDLPRVMTCINAVASPPHEQKSGEFRILTVNGLCWFEWNLTAILNDTGEFVEYQTVGRDVSDRKQMEQALRESEAKFRNFAEHIQLVIWINNPDSFHTFYVNRAYEQIWGRSCQSLLEQPQSWIETVHPEDRHLVLASIEKQQNSQSSQVEYRILRPDGSVRWIWDRGFTIYNEQGEIFCYGGIAEDITERKQAEESLRRSEERLSLALEAAHMGIWDWNLLTNEAVWSPNMGPIYGLPQNSACSNLEEFLNLIHPEDQQLLSEVIANNIETGAEYTIEFRVIWPDGSIHWLSGTGKVYYNELGQPLRMIGTARDITDHKQAEQKIHEQVALLDISTDAIFVRDLQTRISFWNRGAEHVYGWQQQEVLGRKASEFLYKENSPLLDTAFKTVIEQGSWQGELKKLQKSGQEVLVESRWTLVRDATGQPTSVLTVDTDITQKKLLERQFLRTQRLESLGTLAGGIAHDLNNVLTPILVASQLLDLKYIQDPERYRQLLGIIASNAQRGAALVKQVLSFARGFKGERTIVQLKHIISEITQIVKQTFPKSIEFFVTIPEDLCAVFGDATQLHQVLMNLVVNARDAMPEGGNIRIVAGNMYIDETYARMHIDAQVGDYIVVEVIDTGLGMAPEVLDKIFEPFFTTKEVGAGTGLGLANVLGIIKSQGGFVTVSSEVGRGSHFKLFLPAAEAMQVSVTEDTQLPLGNSELILVVDDEAKIREITTIILEKQNYRTLTASNGIEAIAIYAQHKYHIDAVLMDMMMPEMDGITTIRTLQKMNPQVKVITSSGLSPQDSCTQTSDVKVQDFLSKPYTANELLHKLGRILCNS
jgi:PAS domain S-box-containing protein